MAARREGRVDVFGAVSSRRSVKKFDPSFPVTGEQRAKLMELALLSPTSYNQQNWRFVTVTGAKKRAELSEAAFGQRQPRDAPLVVVLAADLLAWGREPERYWKNHGPQRQAEVARALRKEYASDAQAAREEAFRSCGIAAQTIMLAARQMGLDSCPMKGFEHDRVARIVGLPPDHMVVMMVAVGRAAEPAPPRGGQLPASEVVFEEGFDG